MDNKEAKIFAVELGAIIPQLDLHEKFPYEIEDEVRLFVLENFNLEKEMVRIIYGGGTGKMKKKVLETLDREGVRDIIEGVKVAEGECVVVFK